MDIGVIFKMGKLDTWHRVSLQVNLTWSVADNSRPLDTIPNSIAFTIVCANNDFTGILSIYF